MLQPELKQEDPPPQLRLQTGLCWGRKGPEGEAGEAVRLAGLGMGADSSVPPSQCPL